MPKGYAKNGRKRPPRPHAKRRYHDHERFAAITLANALGVASASETTGIPPQTLYCWLSGYSCPHTLDLYNLTLGDLAKAFENLAWDCLSYARDKAEEASFMDVTRAAGMAVDKALLLRGKANVIHGNEGNSPIGEIDLMKLPPESWLKLRQIIAEARALNDNAKSKGTRGAE